MMLGLSGPVHVAPREQLYDALGAVLLNRAIKAVEERGVFHLALSGGSTPEPFYTDLVIDPRYREIPWSNTHIWIVDERQVPPDDERSNVRMIREALSDHLPVKQKQVHAITGSGSDAAAAYEQSLREALGNEGRLDFVLLGMGADAHTASLFPGSPALSEDEKWFVANDGPNVTPPPRWTMTYPLLNKARELAVLVTGSAKHGTLLQLEHAIKSGMPDTQKWPILGVAPDDGELIWFLDPAAAGEAEQPQEHATDV